MTLLTSFWQREHAEENSTSPSLEELSLSIEECLKENEFSTVGYTLWCQAKESATNNGDVGKIRETIRAMLGCNNDNTNKENDDSGENVMESCENVNGSEESKEHKKQVEVHTHDITLTDTHKNASDNNLSNAQNAVIANTTNTEQQDKNNYSEENNDKSTTNSSTLPLPEPSTEPRSALAKLIAKAKKEKSNTMNNKNSTYNQEIPKYDEVEEEQSSKRPKLELVANDGVRTNTNNSNKNVKRHVNQTENDKHDSEEEAEEFTVDLEQGHVQYDKLQDTINSITRSNETTTLANDDKLHEMHAAEDEQKVSHKHPSQMTREEFLRQYKRAPRRGEIGQSAEMVAEAQKLGYVMSGSRNKGADRYVDRVQRQLHEREASKLQQQFRRIEDARMDESMINSLVHIIEKTRHDVVK